MLKYSKWIIHLVKKFGGYLTYHPLVKNLRGYILSIPPGFNALEHTVFLCTVMPLCGDKISSLERKSHSTLNNFYVFKHFKLF